MKFLVAPLLLGAVTSFAPTALLPRNSIQSRSSSISARRHHEVSSGVLYSTMERPSPTSSVASSATASSVVKPNGMEEAWEVHKFGGASLADASLYKTVGDLLLSESTHRGPVPTMAIVSARGGMTDLLVKVVSSALSDMSQAEIDLENAINGQLEILNELAPKSITEKIENNMRKDAADILSVVQSLRMIRSVPPSVMEVVTGFGEIWSAQTLYAYLKAKGTKVAWLDARDVLIVKCEGNAGLGEKGSSSSTGGVTPVWDITSNKLEGWWETIGKDEGVNWDGKEADEKEAPIVIATGFVATSTEGVPTTLKRSGSDYSATIFAKLLKSSRVTMWKNTDGVYTADPRRVPEAFSIDSLKYDEAMELAYFGAQVLHPLAMVPCIDSNIPVYIRNIFNPAFEGTVIQGRCASLKDVNKDGKVVNWRSKKGIVPIKGITSVDKVSLLTLEGASVIGGAEVAERFMGSMADAGIDVLMVTQASSESSITVVIPENQGKSALDALRSTFELELSRSNVNAISLSEDTMSIVAIVGEGMAMNSGVSASFMSSLAKANVNIRVIAQGSSERQVAVVVEAKDASRALRSAHMAFTLSSAMVSVAVLGGTGKLGTALLRQLDAQKENLAKKLNIGVCVNAIASSTKMRLGVNGQCLATNNADDLLGDDADDLDMDALTAALEADVNPHRVVIDCTNCDRVADMYPFWMAAGINVISPNRNAGSGSLDRYNAIRDAQSANSVSWQYESSVGSALPILTTLRDLMQTGDDVQLLRGCLSGTMAYIFSAMNEDVSFTEAARRAVEKDYTENDIREDLTGSDAAAKIVILARELGMDISIDDVEVESLVPDDIKNKEYSGTREEMNDAILEDLKVMNDPMLKRWKEAVDNDLLLRYKFVIDVVKGTCKCSLDAVSNTDTLYRLRNNENLVAFETTRYTSSPLIVKGAAAGPELAASGMFADLLRLGRAFSTFET